MAFIHQLPGWLALHWDSEALVALLAAVLKAALTHFWFVTIHPFEDGNGRIARAGICIESF